MTEPHCGEKEKKTYTLSQSKANVVVVAVHIVLQHGMACSD